VDEFTAHKRTLFTDDPSVLASGGWHWLSGTSKSGLTEAQRREGLRGVIRRKQQKELQWSHVLTNVETWSTRA